MSKNLGIDIPKIKRVADGSYVSESEAKAISTRPQVVTYVYNGLEFAIIVDPRKVTSESEDALNEVQFKLAEVSDIDLSNLVTAAQSSGEDVDQDVVSAKVAEQIAGSIKFSQMAKIMREMEVAQINMMSNAILYCNDPAEENYPNADNLKAGGKLAKVQLKALLDWWNPTVAKPSEEEKKTETQKSTN